MLDFFLVGGVGGGGGVRIVVVRYLSPTTLGNNNLHGRTSPYRFFFYIDCHKDIEFSLQSYKTSPENSLEGAEGSCSRHCQVLAPGR